MFLVVYKNRVDGHWIGLRSTLEKANELRDENVENAISRWGKGEITFPSEEDEDNTDWLWRMHMEDCYSVDVFKFEVDGDEIHY